MPERQFLRGKLNQDDEGEISLGVTVDQDVVVIAFKSPVTWIGMPAEQAEELARVLVARAADAKRNRQ
jgi:hypothetical protein